MHFSCSICGQMHLKESLAEACEAACKKVEKQRKQQTDLQKARTAKIEAVRQKISSFDELAAAINDFALREFGYDLQFRLEMRSKFSPFHDEQINGIRGLIGWRGSCSYSPKEPAKRNLVAIGFPYSTFFSMSDYLLPFGLHLRTGGPYGQDVIAVVDDFATMKSSYFDAAREVSRFTASQEHFVSSIVSQVQDDQIKAREAIAKLENEINALMKLQGRIKETFNQKLKALVAENKEPEFDLRYLHLLRRSIGAASVSYLDVNMIDPVNYEAKPIILDTKHLLPFM